MVGNFASASQNLNETIRIGRGEGAVINIVAASCVLARIYAIQGLLRKSFNTYQTATELIPDEYGQHLGVRDLVEVGIADLLYEWNDLKGALDHMNKGLAMIAHWDKADDLALAKITLARIHLSQANQSGAMEAVKNATQLVQTRGVFSETRNAVDITQVWLWLAQGDLQAANRWVAAQEERLSFDQKTEYENELTYITLARVMIAVNNPGEAIYLLSNLEKNARLEGRCGRLIEILILKALGMMCVGDKEQAGTALNESLALAEPEGYARIFLDEGSPMQHMIAQWLSCAEPGPLRDYARNLYFQFEAESQMTSGMLGQTSPAREPLTNFMQTLVEPLSPRELEVLDLIALGKTNQEIAQQLVVARGTIKAHAASIYRKLDVANRTEAVAQARRLGILP